MQKSHRYTLLALLLCLVAAAYLYSEKHAECQKAREAQQRLETMDRETSLLKEQLADVNPQLERYQNLRMTLYSLLRAHGQSLNGNLYTDDLLSNRLKEILREKGQQISTLKWEHTQAEERLKHLEQALEQNQRQCLQERLKQDSIQLTLHVFMERQDSLQNELNRALQRLQNTQIDTLSFLSPKGIEVSFFGKLLYGEPSGFGIGFYKEKGYYIGHWKDNKRHGRGKHLYLNGDIYEGDFVEDVRQGQGKYIFASGETYEGEWQNDLMHGKGRITFKNGSAKSGTWVEGKMKENN